MTQAAPRRRPDFLGVGVQRSGTTYVQTCLEQHPEIGKPPRGLHFFSRAADYNAEIEAVAPDDFDWYERQLGRFADRKVVGEFSVTYGFPENRERCADAIRARYPDVRILIVMRDPVRRAISEYGKMRTGLEIPRHTTMDEFVDTQRTVIERGRYAPFLETYLARFPREHVHVKVFEDMRADPEAYVASLYEFLGVDASFRPEQLGRNPNPSAPIRYDGVEKAIRLAQDVVRPLKTGPLAFVHRALLATGLREWIRARNVDTGPLEIPDSTRARLAELYRDDVERVARLLGRDLPWESAATASR